MVVVRLLGPVEVLDRSDTTRAPDSSLRRALLALFALRAGEVLSASWLLEHAWAGTPPESGLRALRFHISRLRKELGGECVIETRPGGYRLAVAADQVDVLIVEQQVRAANLQIDRRLAADMYAEALAMWRGAPFTDAAPCSVLDDEAARLRELRQIITEARFQALLDSGVGGELVPDLSRAATQDPLRESLWSMLIIAQYRAGRQADALRSYEQLRSILAESLGLDPSTELQDLQLRVLQQDPTLVDATATRSDRIAMDAASVETPTGQPAPTLPTELELLGDAATFVGRRAELAVAGALLTAVSAGASRTLLLVGEPGVGKTRLAAAVAADALAREVTVVYGRCEEGLAAPYQPVVEAFGRWLAGCADPALRRTVGSLGAELAQLWPELARRLALTPLLSEVDPQTQRWRLFEAVADLVRSIAAERPLMLVVDDMQWAEPSSLLLLAHLVRRNVPGFALVATVRPAESVADPAVLLGELGHNRQVDVLELVGFDAGEVGELVRLRAGKRPPDELAEQLRRHTDGNPFFLTSLLDHLEDVDSARRSDDSWVTSGDLEAVGVPHGLRAVIGRRLSLLGEATLRALEVAAVVGLAFDLRTIGGVLDTGREETIDALDGAVSAGVVREEDAGRYAFVHALIRLTVLEGLSRTRIARLHWRIAEELEADNEGVRSRTGEIAYHYSSGGSIGDAATVVRASLAAGDEARGRTAFEEASNHFRTALAALDRSRPDPDVRYRVIASLGETLNALADRVAARPLWLEAAGIARRAGDPERLFAAIKGYAFMWSLGPDERFDLLDALLEMLSTDDSPVRAKALGWRAVQVRERRSAEARLNDLRMVDDAVAMARRTGDDDALASTLHSRLLLETEAPNASAMLDDVEEVLTVGGRDDAMRRDRHVALWLRAIALLRLGRRQRAEEHLAFARRAVEQGGLRWAVGEALVIEAALATASGCFADGERLAAEAAHLAGGKNGVAEAGYGAQILASRMEQGHLDEVIGMLRQFHDVIDGFPAWRAMLAGALVEAGHHTEASAEVDPLIAEAVSGCTPGIGIALIVRYVPEVCRQLEYTDRAAALLEHVQPWAGQILVGASGGSIEGASDRAIGHLLATVGRHREAAAYTSAAALERAAGFLPHVARTEYWHARLLLERHTGRDRETARRLLDDVVEISQRLGMHLLAEQAARLT